ncbi:uncharacterized protein [Coffea arabica]|uniref:Reverse transcriptase domain-containing protein n=1 Tax=Coffea arabica TaxID=13443 RepID=A0A6P6VK12_COFAR|nr:uncharacterized protein LOC113724655 [Coffea arabica]
MLRRAEDMKQISRISIRRRGPSASHLFFADDTLIFWKAIPSQAEELMKILAKHEKGSGQRIDFDKSFVFFNKNVPEEKQVKSVGWETFRRLAKDQNRRANLPDMWGRNTCSFSAIKQRKSKDWLHCNGMDLQIIEKISINGGVA